jgi:hypothetical protein
MRGSTASVMMALTMSHPGTQKIAVGANVVMGIGSVLERTPLVSPHLMY